MAAGRCHACVSCMQAKAFFLAFEPLVVHLGFAGGELNAAHNFCKCMIMQGGRGQMGFISCVLQQRHDITHLSFDASGGPLDFVPNHCKTHLLGLQGVTFASFCGFGNLMYSFRTQCNVCNEQGPLESSSRQQLMSAKA